MNMKVWWWLYIKTILIFFQTIFTQLQFDENEKLSNKGIYTIAMCGQQ